MNKLYGYLVSVLLKGLFSHFKDNYDDDYQVATQIKYKAHTVPNCFDAVTSKLLEYSIFLDIDKKYPKKKEYVIKSLEALYRNTGEIIEREVWNIKTGKIKTDEFITCSYHCDLVETIIKACWNNYLSGTPMVFQEKFEKIIRPEIKIFLTSIEHIIARKKDKDLIKVKLIVSIYITGIDMIVNEVISSFHFFNGDLNNIEVNKG